jgi:hypothetical protein
MCQPEQGNIEMIAVEQGLHKEMILSVKILIGRRLMNYWVKNVWIVSRCNLDLLTFVTLIQKQFQKMSVASKQSINDFFDAYARALALYDSKGLANLFQVPCMMVSDDSVSNFTDAGRLEGFFNQGMNFYRQFGITDVRAQVWNKIELTSKVDKVKVKWDYLNDHGKLIYSCDYHYILREDKSGHLKIAVSVSVNEKQRMEEWVKQGKPKEAELH